MTETTKSERQLWTGFIESCARFPERPAIEVGHEVTYQELAPRAKRIAATIQTEARVTLLGPALILLR
jgi:non-ribosomal peptide synthetase component F